jgi:hypothetical protein
MKITLLMRIPMTTKPCEYRKVQAMAGRDCLGLVLPSRYVRQLGISKGDHLRVTTEGSKVVLEKV